MSDTYLNEEANDIESHAADTVENGTDFPILKNFPTVESSSQSDPEAANTTNGNIQEEKTNTNEASLTTDHSIPTELNEVADDLNLKVMTPEPVDNPEKDVTFDIPNVIVSNSDNITSNVDKPETTSTEVHTEDNQDEEKESHTEPTLNTPIKTDGTNLQSPALPPRSPSGESPMLPPRSPIATGVAPNLPPRSPELTAVSEPPNLPKRHEAPMYSVPPPLSEEMKSAEFRKNAADIASKSRSNSRVMSPIDSAADINLIANRYRVTSHQLYDEPESKRENIEEGQIILKSTYTTILENEKESTGSYTESDDIEDKELSKIDWDFWTSVVNDFSTVANKESFKLEAEITKGVPRQIRGIIWQLIANSKSKEFEDIFLTLQGTESPHESSIKRDLKRTNFVPQEKVDTLFNLLKVYSVYDPDVGYTQGMGFITTPLLLNCNTDADAFGLLIVLMKNYGIREFFLPEMPGLMLLLYQFDRILEETSPILFNHLNREGIKSSMYATQWFLTFFAYKFPLEFVLRIFDIILFEGFESILKFAINLLVKNQEIIMGLKFENLLNFLKNGLFEYYSNASLETTDVKDNQPIGNSSSSNNNNNNNNVERNVSIGYKYDVDSFVKDAMNGIHITPISLNRYAAEYQEIHQIQQEKEIQYDLFRIRNKQLEKESKKLNHEYSLLNKEHISIANELIENRLKTEILLDENQDLQSTMEKLYLQIQEEKENGKIPNPDSTLPVNLKNDMARTMERNTEVMNENEMLQEKIKQLELHVKELKLENKNSVRQDITNTRQNQDTDNNTDENHTILPDSSTTERSTPSLSGGWKGFKNVFKKE
ncbi:similar to Saccharomyces cerevisiae YPL249C GYP5 GTPase-activating protein (GAP) for yeast Rab family members [Maudiozyma saulgeensis]|uniref:GTPase-activating protein GYP5 n=1 Tax=Maudiozyma saulgeensis TaxID=1789683 RepID=A0A1X7R7A0_9SACH|nr:similar to Saccharomyces cerevisiae YPL249C GYP5 GTPase-activating protein (GAP) for yeast Rab family members [Kazachstania saulgeensis]